MKDKLEILILLKCANRLLQKKCISQYYARYSAAERNAAVENLQKEGLISSVFLPKENVRKTPVFYKITDAGTQWLLEYQNQYPKS